MSKKSKHHKPKGPRNPPQDVPEFTEPATPKEEAELRVPDPKPAPPVIPETKSIIETAAPIVDVSTNDPAVSQTPVKPKRHRGNRKKKNAAGSDDAGEEVKEDTENKDVIKEETKVAEAVQKTKSNDGVTLIKDVDGNKDKNIKAEQGKKNEGKNKKGGANKEADKETVVEKIDAPPQAEARGKKKGKDAEQKNVQDGGKDVKKAEKNDDNKGGDKNNKGKEQVGSGEKQTDIVVSDDKKKTVEEVKEVLKEEETFVESKGGKKGKGKNKKNKDNKDNLDEQKEEIPISEITEEKIIAPKADKVDVSKTEKNKKGTEVEKPKIEDTPKPIVTSDIEMQEKVRPIETKSNKKDKKNKGKDDIEKLTVTDVQRAKTPEVKPKPEEKDKSNKKEQKSEYKKKTDKKHKSDIKEQEDDDILPSLAMSIEDTLQKLIACESDVAYGEKLLEKEAKKEAEVSEHKDEVKQETKPKEQKKGSSETKAAPVVVDEAPKITAILPFMPSPIELICEKKDETKEKTEQERLEEKKTKIRHLSETCERTGTPEPIPLPYEHIEITHVDDIIKAEIKPCVEVKPVAEDTKNKDKKKDDHKTDKHESKKHKKVEDWAKTQETLLDFCSFPPQAGQSIFAGETPKQTPPEAFTPDVCPMKTVREQLLSPLSKSEEIKVPEVAGFFRKTPERFDKKNKTGRHTPVKEEPKKVEESQPLKMTLTDDLIEALLSDIPPPHVTEENKPKPESGVEEMICPLPIAKSETIKDDFPKCEIKSVSEKKTEYDFSIMVSDQVKAEVCEIKKPAEESKGNENIGSVLKDLLLSNIRSTTPTMITPDTKTDILVVKDDVKETGETLAAEKSDDSKHSQKHKSKKHDKKKDSHEHKHETQPADLSNLIIAELVEIKDTEPKQEEKASEKRDIKDSEPKTAESSANVEANKPTDSPKPAKRAKDKKNKQGKITESAQSESVATSGTTAQSSSEDKTKESETHQKGKQKDDAPKQDKQHDAESPKEEKKTDEKESQITESIQQMNLFNIGEVISLPSQSSDESKKDESSGSGFKITAENFEFVKLPDAQPPSPEQGGSKDHKDEVKKDNKPRQRSPLKNHPKNSLGPSDIPAKSNKYDYKKEKNKNPESCNAENAKTKMKNVDKRDLPESVDGMMQGMNLLPTGSNTIVQDERNCNPEDGKNKHQSVKKGGVVVTELEPQGSDLMDDEEEFVYKYSFRTVFIANACHICKVQLNDERVVCRFCHLVSYCSEKHRDDDWMQHQSLCYAICTLSHVKGVGHIYSMAKALSGHDYRLLRMQAIVSCEKLLKRKLCPWEQEVLLYPRICSQPNCRQWKSELLQDCTGCGQVSYCASTPDHLTADHTTWCQPYRLYHKLVTHQLALGRIEPTLPTKIMPKGYMLPDKLASLLDDLYGTTKGVDECHYATLTQLSTAPLTALYAYQKTVHLLQNQAEAAIQSSQINGGIVDGKESMCIHVVGAELQFEADTLAKWEAFFLHLVAELKELKIVFVGPELNTSKLPVNLLTRIKMCSFCRQNGRVVKFEFHDEMLYHDFVESDKFSKPDLICAFNPGFHRATGHAGQDTWPATIACALRLHVPVCATAYTAMEAPRDLARVMLVAPTARTLLAPARNPHASLRPDRNFISDDEAPLIFKNYHCMVVAG